MQLLKFSITLVCLSLLFYPTKSQPNYYFHHNCTDTNNFTKNSTYQSNRDLLLSSLSSNTTLNNNGFTNGYYKLTVGSNTTDPVYGLFLCRGDVDTFTCQKCVNFATSNIVQSCPIETEATAWFNECFLRYSNLPFFSTVEMSPTSSLHNTYNISEPEQFNVVLVATLNDIATQASNNAKRFKTKEVVNSTMFRTLYSLVQCMPDLSSSDCYTCLSNAIEYLPTCCGGKQGGIVLGRSCNIRYEIYPFYNIALTPAPAPPPVVLPPPPKGKC